jgi:hypothetical protein
MATRPFAYRWRNGVAGVALAVIGAAAIGPAGAQTLFGMFEPDVGAGYVAANIQRQGFVMRSALVRRGEVYVVDVSDPNGLSERLIIDVHTGGVIQRFPGRGGFYRQAGPHYAPSFGGGGFGYPPRPDVDVPAARPYVEEEEPEVGAPRVIGGLPPDGGVHPTQSHDLAYGVDGRISPQGPSTDSKPAEKPKAKVAKPKSSASPSASPSDAASTSPRTEPPATTAVEAAKPSAEVEKPTIEAVKPPVEAPKDRVKSATTKTDGVVASTTPAEAPAAPAAPTVAPSAAKEKNKAINDIPVTPLD